nr:F-box/WD repeat-containing protein 12 isoform X3 [Pogona vitticeps]
MSAESLTVDCIIHIFSYLEVPELLLAAQVNKTWNEAAETTFLWRNMCLRRWAFCNISVIPGMQTWKKYYLHRSNLEHKMASGRPSVDYTCKALRGHKGVINAMAYLSENEHTFATGKVKSIMCTTSSDGTVRAWNVQEVGTGQGVLYTLGAADLSQILRSKVFQTGGIDLSHCSPDGQWIVICPTDPACSLKVFYTHCATNPDDELMLSSPLPVTDHRLVTCWLPAEPARIAIMHDDGMNFRIVSFDIVIEKKSKYKRNIVAQQVANFTLPTQAPWMTEKIMKGFGKQTILIAAGLELKLYSLTGTELMAFKDHHKIITSIWVDPFHVVTSSMDLSLRVYSWKNTNKSPSLISRYHLLGGSHRWSSGFRSVACDDVSIVGIVAGTDGTDILRAYSFNL